jgi:alpha-L-fucosidase
VPVRGDGTIDDQERAIVEEIGRWMAVNGEGIYDTRPWALYGEGPVADVAAAPMQGPGFNEGKGKPFSGADIRFTAGKDAVYAFVMGWPDDGTVTIKSMRAGGEHLKQAVARVELVGAGALAFRQTPDGLQVTLPQERPALPYAFALKVA